MGAAAALARQGADATAYMTRAGAGRSTYVSSANLKGVPDPGALAVARLLAHRMLVMKDGAVVEAGLTDRVLDDPQHPYTQLLVSSVLMP